MELEQGKKQSLFHGHYGLFVLLPINTKETVIQNDKGFSQCINSSMALTFKEVKRQYFFFFLSEERKMLVSNMVIFLPSRQRKAVDVESSLAPEDEIRKMMKSWCPPVIRNRTVEIRGIQL